MFFNRIPDVALASINHEMNRMFDTFLDGPAAAASVFPALNIWEDGETLYAEAELPGVSMDDLEVSVEGRELTIRGRREAGNGRERTFHRRERGSGEFARRINLPVDIEADKVEASLKDGVLMIHMPKAQAARARKIEVKTN